MLLSGKGRLTQSEKKVLDQIEAFIETDFFQTEIKKIRTAFDIPIDGFVLTENNLNKLKRKHMPMFIPIELENNENTDKKKAGAIGRAVKSILDQATELKFSGVFSLLKFYLFFNSYEFDNILMFRQFLQTNNLIRVTNLKEDQSEGLIEHIEDFFDATPIAILLHPEATRRDLQDYISEHWREIEAHLSFYKKEKSKFRNVKIKMKRTKLIHKIVSENIDAPVKIVGAKLQKQNIFIDYGNISNYKKIIKNKRKNV